MADFLKNIKLKGDKVIWGVIISLSLFSVLLVYSTAGWEYLFSHLIKLFYSVTKAYAMLCKS